MSKSKFFNYLKEKINLQFLVTLVVYINERKYIGYCVKFVLKVLLRSN